jgi:hypothetical protein
VTRLLLILWLTAGLAPGLGELVESAVHLASAGHLAHSEADGGDLGDQGGEHGCGATHHLCGCCTSQVVVAAHAGALTMSVVITAGLAIAPDALVSLHEPTPPFRPPILS